MLHRENTLLLYIILKVDELCQKDIQLINMYPEPTVLDEAKAAAKFANSDHRLCLGGVPLSTKKTWRRVLYLKASILATTRWKKLRIGRIPSLTRENATVFWFLEYLFLRVIRF